MAVRCGLEWIWSGVEKNKMMNNITVNTRKDGKLIKIS